MRAVRVFGVVLALLGADFLAQGMSQTIDTASAASTKPAPLFVYEEGGDTVSFFSPKTVRIVHGARGDAGVHSCQYDLPENGNMYSGADVENAFRDPVVQAELRARHTYMSAGSGAVTAGSDRVEWTVGCYHGCSPEPTAMQQFHSIVRVVMLNARLVCP